MGELRTTEESVLHGTAAPHTRSLDVVWLDDLAARDPQVVGAKAANLAVARGAGMPVYDGFVLPAQVAASLGSAQLGPDDRLAALRDAWARLSLNGSEPLIVRSSSVLEDGATSSMAGRFLSVPHVRDWGGFVRAVEEVVASGAVPGLGRAPMAVLVQPMAGAESGGVLFGLDPITGDRSSFRVSCVDGLPDQIVSGAVTGTQLVLSMRGRLRSIAGPVPAALDRRQRVRLAAMARRAADVFGGPQDVEWLIDAGELRLLQTRPITATQSIPAPNSRVLGVGPVAETFPEPLRRLELDLWLPPLRTGLRDALRITGALGARALSGQLVTELGGRVAVDLEALGIVSPRRTVWSRLDPRPPTRRVRAAWRVGRLRTGLPAIVDDLLAEVDEHLAMVPGPTALEDLELLTVLANGQRTLAALHAYEVLAGVLATGHEVTVTGASMALMGVARGRAEGLDDAAIVARDPVVLVLAPPAIGRPVRLPEAGIPQVSGGDGGDPLGVAREALRVRVRWVHELMARVAEELGVRLARRGQLRRAEDVVGLELDVVRDLAVNLAVGAVPAPTAGWGPPLPAQFRLAADGTVVADATDLAGGTIGVSTGRIAAEVTHDALAAANKVLVVRTLDPQLATVLPVVAAIVSETGSPLSHLAILAREYRIPTVVGVPDAWSRLRDGDLVLVDGSAGIVEALGR